MPPTESLPPHHQITGKYQDNDAIQAGLSEHYRNFREISFTNEIPHSPERLEQLTKLREATLAWGKDLGFDLSERLPKPEHYHYFSSQEDLKEAFRSLGVEPHADQLGGSSKAGILLLDSHNGHDPMAVDRHETVHSIAGEKHKLEATADGSFDIKNASRDIHAINEMFTDIIALDIAKRYEGKGDVTAGYGSLDIIGDELIKKIGQEIGQEPLAILQEIERIYITADTNAMLKFARILPPEGRKALVEATHTQDYKSYIDLADKLELPAARDKITAIKEGRTDVEFLEWLRKND